MFYETPPSNALRFGDIVSGFALTAPDLKTPTPGSHPEDYRVTITYPRYSVVLSPCCSIGASTLLLSPLIQVMRGWLANPYFVEDFTRINRPMTQQQVLSPEKRAELSEAEKQKRLDFTKPAYALVDYFVYEQHPLLPVYEYTWRNEPRKLGHYMIDFRKIHKVECPEIKSATNCPLHAKVLQLSIDSRAELRLKFTDYFGRIPREDQT
jgi:hypothetical protein